MAVRYAVATGLWSEPATWNGGTLPEPGDSVHANGFAVTIDQDIDVDRISNFASLPATAGGSFSITSIPGGGRRIIGNIYPGPGTCLFVSAPSGTLTVDNIIAGAYSSNAHGIHITGAISLIADTVTGGSASNSYGISDTAALSITANRATGGVTTGTSGISSSGSVLITVGIAQAGANSGSGIATTGSATVVVGSALGSTGMGSGVICSAAATVTAGEVIASAGPGITVTSTAINSIVDVLGEVRASNSNYGISASSGANIRVRGPLYHAPNNRVPVYAPFLTVHAGEETIWEVRDESGGIAGGAPVVLSNFVANSPAPANVRAGVAYGPDGTLTGTAVLPDPSAVAAGVPVDTTVGTAALLLTDVAAITGQQIASATGA